jgi:hypothetical protein
LVQLCIAGLDVVYLAETEWDRNLGTRLGQRRKASAANTFTYRAVNDRVTIVADKPIIGTKEPKTSRPMPPVSAIEYLRDSVLWVPGRHSHSWSEAWKPDDHDGGSIHVALRGLTPVQIEHFKEAAADEARSRYGIEPGVKPLPGEHWYEFRKFLIELRDRMIRGT